MTLHDGLNTLLEYLYVQCSFQTHVRNDVVGSITGLQLLKKPDALLGKRGGKDVNFFFRWSIVEYGCVHGVVLSFSLREPPLSRFDGMEDSFMRCASREVERSAGMCNSLLLALSCLIFSDSSATVGASKKRRMCISTCKSVRRCEITCVASRECPPKSKKSS